MIKATCGHEFETTAGLFQITIEEQDKEGNYCEACLVVCKDCLKKYQVIDKLEL